MKQFIYPRSIHPYTLFTLDDASFCIIMESPTESNESHLPLDLEMWRRLESQANALNSNVMGITEQLQRLMVQVTRILPFFVSSKAEMWHGKDGSDDIRGGPSA